MFFFSITSSKAHALHHYTILLEKHMNECILLHSLSKKKKNSQEAFSCRPDWRSSQLCILRMEQRSTVHRAIPADMCLGLLGVWDGRRLWITMHIDRQRMDRPSTSRSRIDDELRQRHAQCIVSGLGQSEWEFHKQ